MHDPISTSRSFQRFLRAFFDPLTFAQWRGGSFDIRSLAHLSAGEKHQAEDMLLQHLEQGSTDPRIVAGLRDLGSQQAVLALAQRVQLSRGTIEVLQPALALWQLDQAQQALAALIEALLGLPTFLGRMDAAINLRYCCCRPAAEALQQALSDEAPLVRHHATNSLLIIYAPWRQHRESHPLARQIMSDDPQQQETARTRILALIQKRPLPWSEEGSERG